MIELLLILALTGAQPATVAHVSQLVDAASAVDTPAEGSPPVASAGDPIPEPWSSLADCESGSWDADGTPISGSARWDYGRPGGFTHDGYELFDGGLNFHPDTWRWVAGDLGLLNRFPHAYDAPPDVQIQVGAEVQARQGWAAWPVCSRKIGLR